MRFLYLDNNRVAQMRLQKTVEGMAEVISVYSLQEAEEVLTAEPDIDCFFVEYQLKTKNGLYFIREIRSREKYDASPVFLLTPMVNDLLAYKAMKSGANESISKMLGGPPFCALVQKYLDCAHVKYVKRPYYEISCVAWRNGARFFQFCPETGQTVSAANAKEASLLIKNHLTEIIRNGEKVDFDFLDIEAELHRIIPPR